MADKDLFNGHKYVFTKVSSSLVMEDSTDNSHETITFRDGMVVSASANEHPITIKSPSYGEGLHLISHESGDTCAKLEARYDDGFFGLYRNASQVNYLSAGSSTMHYMKTSLATTSTSNILHIEQSDGVDAFRIRGNKDIIVGESSAHTGRIAFGTTSPSAIMQIYDNNVGDYSYMHKFSTAAVRSYVKCLAVQRQSIDKFMVYSYGKIYAHSTSISSISDSRLKEEIVDANSQWDDIKAIEWKNFKYKKDEVPDAPEEHKQLGVIAQQVETISPTLVDESPPTPNQIKQNPIFGTLYTAEDQEVIDGEKEVDDVKEVHHNVKDMNYSILWMKSCAALQEAMVRIEQLEAKVTALENN